LNQSILGHPRGLATLFMTEFFERFTYYGMRAMLVLFLVAAVDGSNPGFGLDAGTAGAIYGLYAGAVYLFALPGGWVADRLIGQRGAVFWGGIIIMLGNFILAVPAAPGLYYVGLAVIAVGVGLLKPNISVIVGALYEGQSAARRDSGFSIFYMGINLGAVLGGIIAGGIGEAWNWHAGFFCAGVFMGLGVIQYKLTEHYLGEAGMHPSPMGDTERATAWKRLWIGSASFALAIALAWSGVVQVDIKGLAQTTGILMLLIAIGFFAAVLFFSNLTADERGRVWVIAIFFVCSTLFWAGFEQAATTFNLFAQDQTDRSLFGGFFPDGMHPATWYQSVNPVFVILFAPVFAWIWLALGRRNLDPAAPVKLGLGLVQLGIGFAVMIVAAQLVAGSGMKAAPYWLLITYLVHTTGELCLSPVGLSNVTRLAPSRFQGQMMGTWFLGVALGNLLAGLIGGHVGGGEVADMPRQFLTMACIFGGAGIVMLVAAPRIRRMMGSAA
jgi:POT family proton-dependent oligopeptide transporter